MKNATALLKKRQYRQGFTLVETVIAMGIITIMITAFFAAFGPAVQGIRKSISIKEANRLSTTLEHELSVIREGEHNTTDEPVEGKYRAAFEKAFDWIEGSFGERDDMILLYQYRGDPKATPNDDGTLAPYSGGVGVPGQDYVLQSVVRKFDNAHVIEELVPGVVEGRVFYVRMAQLVYNENTGALELTSSTTSPLDIVDPNNPTEVTDYLTYPEAVIVFQAQFYLLKSNVYSAVSNFDPADLSGDPAGRVVDRHPKSTGKPIFVRNLAVRR